MNIGIVGLGLIGGSIAIDLKSQLNVTVYGYDHDPEHRSLAAQRELVDHLTTLDEVIRHTEVIILAIPVDAIEALLAQLLDDIPITTVVIDVGSTKAAICRSVSAHARRGRFVAAHPLAGTEHSGPMAAHRGLYAGAKNIICDQALSDADALETAVAIFDSIGCTSYYLDPEEHDRHLAYVSHLSHATSFALGLTVLEIERDEKQIFNLASTGFRSTSRLAKSDPKTWSAIFSKNSLYLTEALDRYIDNLERLKQAITLKDVEAMTRIMAGANDIKRILVEKK